MCDLADFENLRETVASTPRDLHRALFGNSPRVEALVAEITPHSQPEQSKGPSLTGMAFFFQTFSTFTGRQGLWLEDLYVRPEYRNQGIGKALCKQLAADKGCYVYMGSRNLDKGAAAVDNTMRALESNACANETFCGNAHCDSTGEVLSDSLQ